MFDIFLGAKNRVICSAPANEQIVELKYLKVENDSHWKRNEMEWKELQK